MKKSVVITITLIVIAAISLSACATLFKGGTQKVDFSSDPNGAKVYVNGQLMGTTPFELKMEVKKSYNIEFRKEGFENKTVVLTNSVGGGWIVLDILGGVIPIIVDAATGN